MSNAVESQRGHEGGGAASAAKATAAPAAGKATLTEGAAPDGASAGPGAAAGGAPKAHPATSISSITDAFDVSGGSTGGLAEGGDDEAGDGRTLGGAASAISTTNTKAARWRDHGRFAWWIKWRTDGRSGWIVQKITNTYSGTDAAGTAITNASTGTVPSYYEAWAVSAGGTISPSASGTHDMWERVSLGTGSRGRWSMRGEVYWTDTDPATSGMTSGGVANAGILVSGLTAPAGIGSALLTRSANGVWDSTIPRPTHTGAAT